MRTRVPYPCYKDRSTTALCSSKRACYFDYRRARFPGRNMRVTGRTVVPRRSVRFGALHTEKLSTRAYRHCNCCIAGARLKAIRITRCYGRSNSILFRGLQAGSGGFCLGNASTCEFFKRGLFRDNGGLIVARKRVSYLAISRVKNGG